MSQACCHHAPPPATDPAYRRALWVALIVNAAMFVVEIGAGMQAGSVSLLADAVDFFGDAVNYGVSLAVLGLSLAWRARTALLKGAAMACFGVFVIGKAMAVALSGEVPEAMTMGAVGLIALSANVGVALLLYRFRDGDANMRAVWLCTRNDALGNLAVLAAALGVFGSGSAWPDLVVAAVMGLLALSSARVVVLLARRELAAPALTHSHH
jgi:Co/Zn/Cd efflux system component